MNESTEVWVPVTGYEGSYEVSNRGNVRSLPRVVSCSDGSIRPIHGCMLTPLGAIYKSVQLFRNNEATNYLVHRLVAQAFVPNPQELPEVNHKDNNPENNNASNLEWVTSADNTAYRLVFGKRSPNYRRRVTCLETGQEFDSISAAGRSVSASTQQVIDSIHTKRCCKSFTFVYSDEMPEDPEEYIRSAHLHYESFHKRPTMKNSHKVRIVGTDIVFDSMSAAARHFGCDTATIRNRIEAHRQFADGVLLEFIE